MGQFARPAQDVYDIGWTPQTGSDLSAQLNEVTPDDTTLVWSPASPQGNTFEVKLSGVAVPADGTQTLSIRLMQTDVGVNPVRVSLLQGYDFIATWTRQPSTTFQTQDLLLTTQQIESITNYNDLRVLVSVGSPLVTACSECPGGAAWQYTFTPSGIANGYCNDCAGLNVPTTLTWQGGCTWSAPVALCAGVVQTDWTFLMQGGGDFLLSFETGVITWTANSSTWDFRSPLVLNLESVHPGAQCTNFPAQITISPL